MVNTCGSAKPSTEVRLSSLSSLEAIVSINASSTMSIKISQQPPTCKYLRDASSTMRSVNSADYNPRRIFEYNGMKIGQLQRGPLVRLREATIQPKILQEIHDTLIMQVMSSRRRFGRPATLRVKGKKFDRDDIQRTLNSSKVGIEWEKVSCNGSIIRIGITFRKMLLDTLHGTICLPLVALV
jgi:hypothetical protein